MNPCLLDLDRAAVAPRVMRRPSTEARAALAESRLAAAWQAIEHCELCAHRCGVDRRRGESGKCHAGTATRVFLRQTEVGDERELVPTFSIALSGCDLRCGFCITAEQSWNANTGGLLSAPVLAGRALAAVAAGAKTVMVLGGEPTIHIPYVLELVAALPDDVRLVWKTNAHGTAQARGFLDGLFDVWLADCKFGNDICASRLADVPDYSRVVQENLRWAHENSVLIVRHLLMPGHVECCWRPIASWLRDELPGVKVSLRDSFWPTARPQASVELRRLLRPEEAELARRIAAECRLNLIP